MSDMPNVILSLGSNKGNRLLLLTKALAELEKCGWKIIKKSRVWETAPWGMRDQPRFLNMCVMTETELCLEDMIRLIKDIERRLGRKESKKWGPREIDIDIITVENTVLRSEQLSVPHPRMQDRAFVLVPLREIDPEFIHPVTKKTVDEMIGELPPENMEWIIKL